MHPCALFDVETEKFVLGSMFLKGGEIIPTISQILTEADFYRPEHRIAYRHLLLAYAKNHCADLLSFVDSLKTSGDIEKLDLSFVFALPTLANTTAYSERYAKHLKEKARRRELLDFLEKTKFTLEQGLTDFGEICEMVSTFAAAQIWQSEFSRDNQRFFDIAEYLEKNFVADVEEQRKYADRSTGFSNIDEHQIFNAGLYVLGATPACGKTTFAWQLAENLALRGENCIFCSYEMSRLELFSKSLARNLFLADDQTSLTAADIRRGAYNQKLHSVVEDFKKSRPKLQILELRNETIDELISLLRALIHFDTAAPVVFIDYLQIIPSAIENDKQRIDDAVRKLKLFQRETNTTFVVVSSFNRGNYLAPVSFESFKESGNIEYTADVVWALQLNVVNSFKSTTAVSKAREEVRQAKKLQPRELQLKCLKNRHGNDYDCYFQYYSAHDYFQPCDEADFTFIPPPPEEEKPAPTKPKTKTL